MLLEKISMVFASFIRLPSTPNCNSYLFLKLSLILIAKFANASRDSSDPHIKFPSEENRSTIGFRQNSSMKPNSYLAKEILDHEVSKAKVMEHHSPSLVARLMGLDTLPSSVRHQKPIDRCHLRALERDICHNSAHLEYHPHRRSSSEVLDFKDVFEVTETSNVNSHRIHHHVRRMHPPTGVVLDDAEIFNHIPDVPDSTKDIFLEHLQDHNLLSMKHFREPDNAITTSQGDKITILKASKSAKNCGNGGRLKPPESERIRDWCSDWQQEIFNSVNTNFVNPHMPSASQYKGNCESCASPARIVILKPNKGKTRKLAEDSLFTDEDFHFNFKVFSEIAASRIREMHNEGKQKLAYHTELSCPKDSIKITQEKTRKARQTRSSRIKHYSLSERMPFDDNEESEATFLSSDNFRVWIGNCNSSPLSSTESSVSREARRRLAERWKVTRKFQNEGHGSHSSQTLSELLGLSYDRTVKFTEDTSDITNVLDKIFDSNEAPGSTDNLSRIDSEDRVRYVSLQPFVEYNSSLKINDRERDVATNNDRIEDVTMRPSCISLVAKMTEPQTVSVRNIKNQIHGSQLEHLVAKENMLPEQETDVSTEGSRKRVHMAKTTIHPSPMDCANSDSRPKSCVSIPQLGDESWEEKPATSALELSLDNEGLIGQILNAVANQETSFDNLPLEPLHSEPDMGVLDTLSTEENEQPSPVSVLETPSEDEAYSSGCFERLKLRRKLELLKLESTDVYTQKAEVPPNKRCCDHDMDQELVDSDDRDFAYMLDTLQESGFLGIIDNKLVDTLDQNLFDKLEKKYNKVVSWPRSERRLLFDLISCTLTETVARSCKNVHSMSELCPLALDCNSVAKAVWQTLVEGRKLLDCSDRNEFLDKEWLLLVCEVDLIAIRIEGMVNDVLLEELVFDLFH
ncbi:hypothetical protein ZIOFF_036881 [Zingiber officinale]|uniref:DUF4378 domain-containing protein n=1 Tax=Zingiber officinale TaxID=94328 RepID=A0A8J5GJ75_ZINOF|nr:hypothetical protein ZIOFF_036881 [Zingiber officinale]